MGIQRNYLVTKIEALWTLYPKDMAPDPEVASSLGYGSFMGQNGLSGRGLSQNWPSGGLKNRFFKICAKLMGIQRKGPASKNEAPGTLYPLDVARGPEVASSSKCGSFMGQNGLAGRLVRDLAKISQGQKL